MTTWRLVLSEPASGPWNMALDETLLESCTAHQCPSTLRFYSWEPACLSLGYAQLSSDVDMEKLNKYHWDIVRRPTGGKSILHTDELTYSITASNDEPVFRGSILESYQRLSQALLLGLNKLGIPALTTGKAEGFNRNRPVCFESPSDYEITVDGKKIIGSAQARRMNGVLQHGAIPLKGDLTRIDRVLKFAAESERSAANTRLLSHATTLSAVMGNEPEFQVVQDSFFAGFRDTFDIAFINIPPTEKEISRAKELMKVKYANHEWTFRI